MAQSNNPGRSGSAGNRKQPSGSRTAKSPMNQSSKGGGNTSGGRGAGSAKQPPKSGAPTKGAQGGVRGKAQPGSMTGKKGTPSGGAAKGGGKAGRMGRRGK
jgi:hypothetical protein